MDDLISRQAAIDEIRKCRFVVDAIEKIRELPSAQPEERTDKRTETHACDCVSRQAAIDEFDKGAWGVEWDKALAKAMVDSLPSAQPERKRGQWIYTRYYTWECSECGCNPTKGMGYTQAKETLFPFCPNCGADMRRNQ